MGIFGASTPFDADIEKATSEKNTNEDWSLILDVCDKVTSNPRTAKDCLKSIMRRMAHTDPHVVMKAITLLDACVNNCGKPFHLEIASRDFETEFRKLLTKAQPKVSARMCQVLKSWAEGDFKNDSELNLIPFLYQALRNEGFEFSSSTDKTKSATRATISKDPNVVSSQQEEDDIAKAIELSLKETKNSPKQQTAVTISSSTYPSLYPSVIGGSTVTNTTTAAASASVAAPAVEPRKVRALYDFEAAEDNELTFYAGEIIHVVDDSDANWWKGLNQRGEGLFPSNFVSADLSVDPERLDMNLGKSKEESVEQKKEEETKAPSNQRIEIDEIKVDRLLHLLHEANPEDPSEDSEEMLRLEQEVNQMAPLIDTELERVDRKHAQLTQLSSDLVDAINMYHSLMRDDRAAMLGAPGHYMMPPGMPNNIGMHPSMIFGAGPAGAFGNPGMSGNFNNMPQMNMLPPVSNGNMPQYPPQGVVPMHFQNGHATNGNPTTMNVLPQMLFAQQQQHLQQQQPGATINQPQPPQQQQPQPTHQMYVQAVQQQQQQQQLPPPTPPIQQPGMPVFPQQQQQQAPQTQYMPADHQQQQQQQHSQFISSSAPQQQQPIQMPSQTMPNFMAQQQGTPQHQQPVPYALPNGGQPYMPTAPTNGAISAEQFSQFQQQMAAMSLGVGNNQPVTQNFLVQNETKNNIPIYQQQR